MNEVDISVIVPTYNQSRESIEKTLRSIAGQTGCAFEVIIADDFSTIDPRDTIADISQSVGIEDYLFLRPQRNQKTTRNVYGALKHARGRYAKTVCAGDALYSDQTLKRIVDFCDKHSVDVGFGEFVLDVSGQPYNAPHNARSFPPSGHETQERLLGHQLLTADWVPGFAQFFRTTFYLEMLKILIDDYGVDYCEDLTLTISLPERPVYHLDENIMVYEWGTGISTQVNPANTERLYKDHTNFYHAIGVLRPMGHSYPLARLLFKARKFVALKTPLYATLKRRAEKAYLAQH